MFVINWLCPVSSAIGPDSCHSSGRSEKQGRWYTSKFSLGIVFPAKINHNTHTNMHTHTSIQCICMGQFSLSVWASVGVQKKVYVWQKKYSTASRLVDLLLFMYEGIILTLDFQERWVSSYRINRLSHSPIYTHTERYTNWVKTAQE